MASLEEAREDALRKAVVNLARHKHANYGYWASIYIHLGRLQEGKHSAGEQRRYRSPLRPLVDAARRLCEQRGWDY